jgi:hypothetical protein
MFRKILYLNPNFSVPASSTPPDYKIPNNPNSSFVYLPPSMVHFDTNEIFDELSKKKFLPYNYVSSCFYNLFPKEHIVIIFNDKNTCMKVLKNTPTLPAKKCHLALLIENISSQFTLWVDKDSSLENLLKKPFIQSTLAWIHLYGNENICVHCSNDAQ